MRAIPYLLAGACLVSASARAAEQLDLAALYRAAAAEGEVSLYGQGPPRVYADWVSGFEAKYPKLRVRVTGGRYELATKIDDQIAAQKLDADLAAVQTASDYVRWRGQGALMAFRPPGFDKIPADFKDAEGRYLGLSINVVGFAYNPAGLAGAAPPKTIPDFLGAAFQDKIVSTYPHDDDVTLFNYSHIVEKYGWGFMGRLMAQRPKFVRSHILVADVTASGERPVTFDQIAAFNKVTFVVPEDVPLSVFPVTTGIFAKAPHPNAAKLFLAFLLSPEYQARMASRGDWPIRTDAPPPKGFKPIGEYRAATNYIAFVADQARVKELREKFEKIIGPPTGQYINIPASK
jgi:ABC-type Fe3+ transport system substrate-binding protein